MSTINVNRIVDSSGGVLSPISSIMRNRLINGNMVIDQRNAGASVTQTNAISYTLDRWRIFGSVTSKFTAQQDAGAVTPPAGFRDYLGITSSAATSLSSGDGYRLEQSIEGYNIADLDFGTANAKTITASFWVRSSLTGTFGGSLWNVDATRVYVFSYTISAANTWEYKTVTIAGDTSGTWNSVNGQGLVFQFSLGAGSDNLGTAGSWGSTFKTGVTGQVNVVGTNGATFYITGVQLEVGTQATSFEYRQYTTELQLCQRYFETNYNAGTAVGTSFGNQSPLFQQTICTTNGQLTGSIPFKVSKRTSPSIVFYNRDGTANQWLQGKQGQTESTYTPAAVTNNQYMFGWSNAGINTDSNVHYGMFTASAEL